MAGKPDGRDPRRGAVPSRTARPLRAFSAMMGRQSRPEIPSIFVVSPATRNVRGGDVRRPDSPVTAPQITAKTEAESDRRELRDLNPLSTFYDALLYRFDRHPT